MTIKRNIFSLSLAFAVCAWLLAACGAPKQSPCSVEVYSPNKQYSEVMLYDAQGNVLDSTLTVKNDSVLFTRDDIKEMPYIATLHLRNPAEKLDMLVMPIVIEGGTVKLELADRFTLGGTDDNKRLFEFMKAKNSHLANLEKENISLEELREKNSEFFSGQILLNKDNIVGEYILDTFSEFISFDEKERLKAELEKEK